MRIRPMRSFLRTAAEDCIPHSAGAETGAVTDLILFHVKELKNVIREKVDSQDHDFIKIEVRNVDMDDINDLKINFPAVKQSKTINGKEGILAMDSQSRNHFYYLEGDKLVCINAPFVELVTGKNDEDVIADIIK